MMSGGQFRTLAMFFSVAGEHFLLETENTAKEDGKFKSFFFLEAQTPGSTVSLLPWTFLRGYL